MWINLLRWGSTAIAGVALVLTYLNIEKLAEKFRWDQILVNALKDVPDLFPSLPWWLWPGLFLFFGGATLALWVNHLLSKIQQRITPTAPIGGGPDPAQAAPAQSADAWNDEARLTLVFDETIQNAVSAAQENVQYYYWLHSPGFKFDCETDNLTLLPGSVTVFLSLKDPTHTNYYRVHVVGGGVHCAVLGHHPAGATVSATGDLRGRTLDIRFSKTPIPL